MIKLLAVVGTRPEAIKMAPVIKELQSTAWCQCVVVATAQHRQMLDQVFSIFDIRINDDLDVMRPAQTLAGLTSALFTGLDAVFERHTPDIVIAQGDTTTAMVCSLAAFYRRIPFGHVEAGLRTGDLHNPFPEELNRIVAGRVAELHFAPTASARQALLREHIPEKNIFVTGNTVIDALLVTAAKSPKLPIEIPPNHRTILLTAHRRESFGAPLVGVFLAVQNLVKEFVDLEVIYPVHPNPNVKTVASKMLGGQERIHLLDPLDYQSLVACMQRSTIILTDSGGIQEEAPALGKPVLVLRRETERPEAITAGVAKLVGTDQEAIYREAKQLLTDVSRYQDMARAISPYGDGKASIRISAAIRERFREKTASSKPLVAA